MGEGGGGFAATSLHDDTMQTQTAVFHMHARLPTLIARCQLAGASIEAASAPLAAFVARREKHPPLLGTAGAKTGNETNASYPLISYPARPLHLLHELQI